VRSKLLIQLPGLSGERAEAFKDKGNRIRHGLVAVKGELSLFVLVAVLNRPAQASEPRNGLGGQLVGLSDRLEEEYRVSNGVVGLGSGGVQFGQQGLREGHTDSGLLLGGRRAHQGSDRLGGGGHGSDAGGTTARSSSRHGWTGGFGFYQGDTRLQFFYQKKKNGLPLFLFIFFLYFFLLCVWLGYLFFRVRHDASLAEREVEMEVLLGAAGDGDVGVPLDFGSGGLLGACSELFHCFLLLGVSGLEEIGARTGLV